MVYASVARVEALRCLSTWASSAVRIFSTSRSSLVLTARLDEDDRVSVSWCC